MRSVLDLPVAEGAVEDAADLAAALGAVRGLDKDLAASFSSCSEDDAVLVLAALEVFKADGDLPELSSSLVLIAEQLGNDAATEDGNDDEGDAWTVEEEEDSDDEEEEEEEEEGGGADDEEEEGADEELSAAGDGSELPINAHPSSLLFHQVVFLVKKQLGVAEHASAKATVRVAADQLELDFDEEFEGEVPTLRQKLDLILIELRSMEE